MAKIKIDEKLLNVTISDDPHGERRLEGIQVSLNEDGSLKLIKDQATGEEQEDLKQLSNIAIEINKNDADNINFIQITASSLLNYSNARITLPTEGSTGQGAGAKNSVTFRKGLLGFTEKAVNSSLDDDTSFIKYVNSKINSSSQDISSQQVIADLILESFAPFAIYVHQRFQDQDNSEVNNLLSELVSKVGKTIINTIGADIEQQNISSEEKLQAYQKTLAEELGGGKVINELYKALFEESFDTQIINQQREQAKNRINK